MEKVAMKDELERGHEVAKQLERLILKSSDGGDDDDSWKTTSYAEDLVAKVVDSFTNTIMIFNNIQHSHRVSADSLMPAANSHKSHESCYKSKSPTIINKYGTTCSPKKRKITHTWEEDTKMSPKQDGYVWRKYGQKIIQHAKYPRSYFRCSYKREQGCEATKQVQRIQDDPPLYKTTYFNYHTCSNAHMFHNSNDLSTSTSIISFHNNTPHNNTTFHLENNNSITFLPSMTFPSSIENDDDENNVPSSSWNDGQLLSPYDKVLPFESADLVDVIISSAVFDPFDISSLL